MNDADRRYYLECLVKNKIISKNQGNTWFKPGNAISVEIALPREGTKDIFPSGLKQVKAVIDISYKEDQKEINKDFSSFCISNFVITIIANDIAKNIQYKCFWHLDFDMDLTPKIAHPISHLTYGGEKMEKLYKELNDKYSDIIEDAKNSSMVSFIPLLLRGPRIPFPPMDLFLGVDFLLSNFWDKDKHKILQSDSKYKKVIKESQEKLWKPFYQIIANHWKNGEDYKTKAKNLNPCLI